MLLSGPLKLDCHMVFENDSFYPNAILSCSCIPELVAVNLQSSQYKRCIALEAASKRFYVTENLTSCHQAVPVPEDVIIL